MSQIVFFKQDLIRILGKRKIRIIHIWMSRVFWGVFLYRIERGLYLLMGNIYPIFRVITLPVLYPLQAYSNMEIHYKADIDGGLLVLHPSCGVVISALSKIGKNLTITGGNIIGGKPGCPEGGIQIGSNCTLGANATIIGPVIIADDVTIGASACVIHNCFTSGSILAGVPAKALKKQVSIK